MSFELYDVPQQPYEEITIDPKTGGQKGRKDCELGFIDPIALIELGKVASYGAKKYDEFNYLKGYKWLLTINAMFRHILAACAGQDRDPESGCLHWAHAAWHCLALCSYTIRKLGTDDRAKSTEITI